MKTLLMGLILCGSLWAQKAYTDLPITVTSTRVNAGTLRIETRDKNNILKVRLTFTCTVGMQDCSAPTLGPKVYWLSSGSPKAKCDEYIIDDGRNVVARVCLAESSKATATSQVATSR